jgi:parallel beta-helix repeat protein
MKKQLVICSLSIILGIYFMLCVILLGANQQVRAATTGVFRYVSTLGVDGSNNCTSLLSPCRTIQHAINQSSLGDDILVSSGVYNEHITMVDGVSIYGKGWDFTTIDGGFSSANSVVTFPPGISASTVFSGFKVMGGGEGYASISNPDGGGLKIGGSPSIVNTWIYSCTGNNGGGVYVFGGSPTFNNVPVWNNLAAYGGGFFIGSGNVTLLGNPFEGTNGTVLWNTSVYAGGGFFLGEATVTMIGLRIYGNHADEGGGLFIDQNSNKVALWLNDISANTSDHWGGGMRVWKATNLDFFGNFIGNKVPFVGGNWSSGDGAGISFLQSAGIVHNNWFLGNISANGYGGAASFCYASPNLILSYNWFEGNSANYRDGGALSLYAGADPQIDANTIVSNTASLGGGMDISEAGAVIITNNIIARNHSTNISPEVGGIHIYKSPVQIINNTIASNEGDGVWFDDSNYITIFNNILYHNSYHSLQGDVGSGTDFYSIDYNDYFANTFNAYSGVPAGGHDLQIDPLLNLSGEVFNYYHLQLSSPVKSTGYPGYAPNHDIDNQSRPSGGIVSIGADQVIFPVYLPLVVR